MTDDLHTLSRKLAAAKCPEDLFEDIEPNRRDHAHREIARIYRQILLVIHPDHHSGTDLAIANACMMQLEKLRHEAITKIDKGTYGDRRAVVPVAPVPKIEPQIVKTPKAEYLVEEVLGHGDLATVYAASMTAGGKRRRVAFKLANHPGDNDLLEHDAAILSSLERRRATSSTLVSRNGFRFIPRFVDAFKLRGASKTLRHVSVLKAYEGYVSLSEILEEYPSGMDFRDVAWIFKRMLYALWFVHTDLKIVHGAIVPAHVLVHPIEHGAKLIDWSYAVENWPTQTGHVKAISTSFEGYYPPEILAKKPPTPQTDIYMAAKCAIALLGGDPSTNAVPTTVPAPIRSFLQSCLLASQHRRPNDAGQLLEEFDQLLLQIVGNPTYRQLVMPQKRK